MSIPGRVSVLVLSAIAVSTAAMAQDWTEERIVEVALRDGPRARAIRAGAEVTRAGQHARTIVPNPTIVYSREGAGFTEFLQVEQPLPLWGTRAALTRAGVAATAAAEAERDAQLWTLRADIRRAVAELAAAQDAQRTAAAAVTDLETLVERLRVREREGEGSRYDRLRAERERADAKRLLAEAGVQVARARAELTAALPAGQSVATVAPAADRAAAIPALDVLLTRAREARPELRALQRDAERAAHEATAARRARLPQPSAAVGVKRADGETGRERGVVFGVNVAVPLFDTGTREAARWHAERARVDAETAALRQELEAEVRRGVEVLGLRRTAATEYASSVQETQALRQIADTGYAEGELGLLALIDAYRADWQARSQAVTVRLHVTLAEIDLERAVGAAIWP